jgi:hypothetical protein
MFSRIDVNLDCGDVDAQAEFWSAALGATRLTDRIAEAGTSWVVMADPEGNEFCVCAC